MHLLISPPSPSIIIIHQSLVARAAQLTSAHPWIMCVSIYIHYCTIACYSLRTFMIPCPYAFVGTEMTTRHAPPSAGTCPNCAPPLWYTSDRPSRWGWGAHMSLPCHRACQILIFSYHSRPYQLNYFFGGPELAHAPRHATRLSPSCLERTYTNSGSPLIAILGTCVSRDVFRWVEHFPKREF